MRTLIFGAPVPWLIVLPFLGVACESNPRSAGEDDDFMIEDFTVLVDDSALSDVRDVLLDRSGSLWVLSSFEPHVTFLPSVGGVPLRFGVSGPGPGELRAPWYLAAHPEGVAVYDAGARRLKVYASDGGFVEELEAPDPGGFVLNDFRESNHGEPLKARRIWDGWVFETYTGQVSHSGALWAGMLQYYEYGPDGRVTADTLLRYDTLRSDPVPEGFQLFAAAPLWTVCPNEQVVVLNPLDSTVTEMDREGRSRRTVVPVSLDRLAPGVVEDFVDRRLELAMRQENVEVDPADLANLRQQALDQMMAAAPEFVPPTRILCDEAHRFWVQGFSVATDLQGYGPSWEVFEGGARVARVTFPPRVFPVHVGPGGILAVWRDDLDVERLVRLSHPLTGSG